ncbi:hypothetical protein AMTRI_Chr02g263480 [Amborella trichopoda]
MYASSTLPTIPQMSNTLQQQSTTTLLLQLSTHEKELNQIHAHMAKTDLLHNPIIASKIISSYALTNPENPSLLFHAQSLFSLIENPNSFMWNTMIRGYSKSPTPEKAILFYYQMLFSDSPCDKFTYPFVLKACSQLSALEEGQQVHSHIIKSGFGTDIYSLNTLIHVYSRCNHLGDAIKVFDRIPRFDLVSWNSMIVGFIEAGLIEHARSLFNEMPERSTVSWNSMLSGYTKSGSMNAAYSLFIEMPHKDANSWNSMISGYLEFGSIKMARSFFDKMPCRDAISWNLMIDAYVNHGEVDMARLFFNEMPKKELITWNFLLGGYVKGGQINIARELFNQMEEKNVITWNTMISGYSQSGHYQEAFDLFRDMLNAKVEPDSVTFGIVLSVCARLGSVNQGLWLHAYLDREKMEIDAIKGTALINMYSKCGHVEKAIRVFKEVRERDIGTWNAMIVGLAIHGFTDGALRVFEDMLKENITPNAITFIGVLSACSHGGLVSEGRRYFALMSDDYQIEPNLKHYGCMVDVLGRAGYLEEAQEVIRQMPIKPDQVVWATLLAACRLHNNLEIGEYMAKGLMELSPSEPSGYVLLSNIYAAAKRWEDVIKVRKMMRERGVKKVPGCTSIELNGEVYEFVAGDYSHPLSNEIYIKLDEMTEKLRMAGYVPRTGQLLFDIDEDEKETAVYRHSEKLAIAFGLIGTEQGAPIRLSKNLRICPDCHSASKFLSKVYSRDIIVRDRIRFHHFRNGSCSCNDYW